MTRSGFDQAGEEGGFRRNIRDLDKQKALEEEEGVVKSDETVDRIVARAKVEWEERPEDSPSILKYVKALAQRRKGDDEKLALDLLERTYERTREYRFREFADQIRVRQGRWKVAMARKAVQQTPDSETAKGAAAAAQQDFTELLVRVGEGLVAAYPTDLSKKYELGKAYFALERYEDAIGMFQEAQSDAKRRTEVLGYLGKSFQSIGWQDAAIDTYRKALESRPDMDDEVTMGLRHGLMSALEAHAREQRDAEAADEAYKLASSIAMQNFNYRDIRERRQSIKSLLDELKAAGS
jgi:tetratricopeptide (TPR) repeat protein